ncbi:MAG TPA: hypothetical protein VHQ90_00145 [Thermoanaerobaculia bacterium]|nr:hypothetical protein [Thermoanaerobaculia bacterium]
MGAYGSPELGAVAGVHPVAAPPARRRRSTPLRVILWALAVIAVCVAAFCVLMVVAVVHAVATMPVR